MTLQSHLSPFLGQLILCPSFPNTPQQWGWRGLHSSSCGSSPVQTPTVPEHSQGSNAPPGLPAYWSIPWFIHAGSNPLQTLMLHLNSYALSVTQFHPCTTPVGKASMSIAQAAKYTQLLPSLSPPYPPKAMLFYLGHF